MGDPIEIAGLKGAFAGRKAEQSCAIGSVKSNLVHLEVAAGIAGLIKTGLCLQHCTLVLTLHMQRENPALKLAEGALYVNRETRNWETSAGLRTAGLSAFGIGGTNAQVILQEALATLASDAGARRAICCASLRRTSRRLVG